MTDSPNSSLLSPAMEPEKLGIFRIGRILGRGGMGTVYEGTCETDDTVVALKVLTNSFEEDSEDRIRFESEIDTLKRLRHPNIVRLSGFGEEQGQLYYVMELVDGSSLHQELKKKRFFQWHEAAKIGLDLCQALRHAHDRGVIHRDIKPANILLDKQGNVKLSDFGIARFFGSQQITDAHTVIGTLEYMSPEQALALPISSSSDIYSLGCVLYALLTGKPPFLARSLPELLRKHRNDPPAPIRSVRHDVPENLEYIVADLLQIRPEDRPRNALLAIKRLQSLLRALIGDPTEIKVLPTLLETPVEHREPVSISLDGVYQPIPHLHNEADNNIVDIGNVKPEKEPIEKTPATPPPSRERLVGSDYSRSEDSAKAEVFADTVTAPAVRLAHENPLSDISNKTSGTPLPRATRFTAVESSDFDAFDEERPHPIVSLPTALASIALMIVGLTIYYLLQPIPPEVLFKRITATVRVGKSADGYALTSLRSARRNMQNFLNDYGDHPLAEQVWAYQDELELLEYERRMERRAPGDLSPMERAYLGILAMSPYDPEQTIDKLRAFVALFQAISVVSDESAKTPRFTSSPVETCVELARRRLKNLEQDFGEINEAQTQVLRRRLDEAANLDTKNPRHAEEIRHGIIELYKNYRWAKELVEEAEKHLEK